MNGISIGNTTREKISWGVIIQLITIIFLAGIAYASFETKNHAAETAAELKKFNAETYMPRELSLEKWHNNDLTHEEMKAMLSEILHEIQRGRKVTVSTK